MSAEPEARAARVLHNARREWQHPAFSRHGIDMDSHLAHALSDAGLLAGAAASATREQVAEAQSLLREALRAAGAWRNEDAREVASLIEQASGILAVLGVGRADTRAEWARALDDAAEHIFDDDGPTGVGIKRHTVARWLRERATVLRASDAAPGHEDTETGAEAMRDIGWLRVVREVQAAIAASFDRNLDGHETRVLIARALRAVASETARPAAAPGHEDTRCDECGATHLIPTAPMLDGTPVRICVNCGTLRPADAAGEDGAVDE